MEPVCGKRSMPLKSLSALLFSTSLTTVILCYLDPVSCPSLTTVILCCLDPLSSTSLTTVILCYLDPLSSTSLTTVILCMLSGSPQTVLDKLQKVQTSAARLVSKVRKQQHIRLFLQTLHWLPKGAKCSTKPMPCARSLSVKLILPIF